MKRGRIVEVDYNSFIKEKNAARKAGLAVFPSEREKWNAAIQERDIREKAFRLVAQERYQATEFVILSGDAPWDGVFAYDPDAQTCIHFEIATFE